MKAVPCEKEGMIMDWEWLGRCQYGIYDKSGRVVDCRKPAVARIWSSYDELIVCAEHLEQIKKKEKEREE